MEQNDTSKFECADSAHFDPAESAQFDSIDLKTKRQNIFRSQTYQYEIKAYLSKPTAHLTFPRPQKKQIRHVKLEIRRCQRTNETHVTPETQIPSIYPRKSNNKNKNATSHTKWMEFIGENESIKFQLVSTSTAL